MSTAHGRLWDDTLSEGSRFRPSARPAWQSQADVVIVGAGLTGLWTAYYLSRLDPQMSVMVLERDTVGFGASGRNGGWCSAVLPMSLSALARRHGKSAAQRLQIEMHDTVDQVIEVTERENIDCDLVKGGTFDLVRSPAQLVRARERLAEYQQFGFGEQHHRFWSQTETAEHIRASEVRGAVYTPHCATLHPAKLVHGLAEAVSRAGVAIHEHTEVTSIQPHRVETAKGPVSARVVVRATEAYTSQLPGLRRAVVPLYSMMIATEPLPSTVWDEIGLAARPTFADHRHTIIYGQRTDDDRFAFGGRGAPYHFGSSIRPEFDMDQRVQAKLQASLVELFPVLRSTEISHHWGGPLGVPRDLHSSVNFDPGCGLASAGGYVGDGVATANLAGRTLAHLVSGQDSDLCQLAWVNHRSRRWEPEPIRWLGINAVRIAADLADRNEPRRGTRRGITDRVMRLLGRH
jgi:glycine/D-amino acid oxidase-like deaminating enzyme